MPKFSGVTKQELTDIMAEASSWSFMTPKSSSLEALWGSMFGTSLSAPESEEKMLE